MTATKWTVAVAALALVAIAGSAGYGTPHSEGMVNVLIVTLDTTRADRLSPYGYMDVRMPHLDRLAREGVVFTRALSVAPLTLPAHTSILTGLLPSSHGVRDNADRALDERFVTLAEILGQRGFTTGAFVGSIVLDADRGLSQGFSTYQGVPDARTSARRQRPGNEVTDAAIRWLEQNGDRSFLLWTHLYDAHAPYEPPAPYRTTVADPYIGELLFEDEQVGRLLGALDRLQLAKRTIVIVVGDHGEGLGDHGELTHGQLLYDSVLRVPLIVRAASVRPRTVTDLVRQVDVVPTILSLLDVPVPPVDGVSLMPALHGHRLDLDAYAESLYPARLGEAPRRALTDGRFKLIVGKESELYDLDRDPFEARNLILLRPQTLSAMQARLSNLTQGEEWSRAAMKLPSAEVRARLAALGYTSGAAGDGH